MLATPRSPHSVAFTPALFALPAWPRHRRIITAFGALLLSALPSEAFLYSSEDGPDPPKPCHMPSLAYAGDYYGENSYAGIRKSVIGAGFRPYEMPDSSCNPQRYGKDIGFSCAGFPEEYDCAQAAGCEMRFRDKAGSKLTLFLGSDVPVKDMIVVRWELECRIPPPPPKPAPTVKFHKQEPLPKPKMTMPTLPPG